MLDFVGKMILTAVIKQFFAFNLIWTKYAVFYLQYPNYVWFAKMLFFLAALFAKFQQEKINSKHFRHLNY